MQYLTLLFQRQIMGSVYHLFALSNPALVSALSKKSFSSVSCPILAWRSLRSGCSGFDGVAQRIPSGIEAIASTKIRMYGCNLYRISKS
jgi:hypothetical protein